MKVFDKISSFNNYSVGIADNDDEIKKAQILRYDMLILDFDESKSKDGIDESSYDNICDLIIVKDLTNNEIVGTYRLLSNINMTENDKFLCEEEFNIDNLKNSNLNILELGRAVVHKDYRNGIVLKLLWQGIMTYCLEKDIKIIFGTASFHGTDYSKYKNAFSNIYYNYLADESIRCYAKPPCEKLDLLKQEEIDENLAKLETPSLVRWYFSLGCRVGDGVYFDNEFNSSDIMMIFHWNNLNKKYVKRMFGVDI